MKSEELKKRIKERIVECCSLVYRLGQSSQLPSGYCQLKNENVRVEEKRTIEDICKIIEE